MEQGRYEKVPGFFLRHHPLHGIDDITWNDLELDRIYHQMDSTLSAAGEEYLYALLRTASGELQIPHSVLCYLEEAEHTEERMQLQLALRQLDHCGRYSLYDYLDQMDQAPQESNLQHLPAFLLPIFSIALLFWNTRIGILCLIGSLILNMMTYYRRKGEIDPYITTCAYLLRLVQCTEQVSRIDCPAFAKENEELSQILPQLREFTKGSGLVVSGQAFSGGNPLDLILDYIRILFHLDLVRFNSMLQFEIRNRQLFEQMLRLAGRIDAAIALASYEKSLPGTCEPHLNDSDNASDSPLHPQLEITGLYHPLLEDPVPNNVTATQSILLTGSNASGKSTFLKAVAICALFAQTVGYCPAKEYKGNRFRIGTSMALRDNLLQKESYFMVEIRSLKRICDMAEESGDPVLCCVDEVLRGTNTVERIAASAEILKELAGRNVLCFAATHDIELTAILAEHYENDHFEEELEGEDVHFSYRLKKGPATTRNAIRLLAVTGFDPEVTRRAAERAEGFERTGRWDTAKERS